MMLTKPYGYLVYPFILAMLLLPLLGIGQGSETALRQAKEFLQQDQLDSAQWLYQEAYQNGDLPLRALAGLINVAVQKSALSVADSLIQVGEDQWMEPSPDDRLGLCQFLTSKGQYLIQNSQLEEALQLYQQIIPLSQTLTETPAVYAYALFNTALTFEKLTVYDSSLYYAQQAYPLFVSAIDSTDAAFARIYNGLAVCYQRANDLPQAKDFYLKSIAVSEAQLGPVSSDLAISLNNVSSIFRAQEDYQQAIVYSERALQIYQTLKDDAGIASAYYALGIYHYFLGDYGRCKDYMEACIAIRKRLYTPLHYSLIGPCEVLGIANEEGGNYVEMLKWLGEGRKRILANYPAASLLEGFNYENTALAFKSLNQLDSALHYVEKAHRILPQNLPPEDYSMAVHYFTYADILYHNGTIEASRARLRQSNAIYESLGMDMTSEYALNLALDGLLYIREGNWELAQKRFAEALRKVRLAGEDQLSANAFPWSPNTLLLLNHYTDFLFKKYRHTGDKTDLRQFEVYAALYLSVSEKFRKQFTDPYTKSILIKDNAAVYQRNIGIYHQLYEQHKDPKYLKAVYQFSEHGRTCLLRDIQDNKITHFQGVPDSVLEKENRYKERINRASEQVWEYPDSQQLKQVLFDFEKELDRYLDLLKRKYPHYYRLKFNSQVPGLEEIQAALKSEESVLEYMHDDTAYYALVITPTQRHLQHLGHRKNIDERIVQWKEAITALDPVQTEKESHALYRLLWSPIASYLPGERVIIIPSGKLFYLNFEVLKAAGADATYLIYDYHISYALSLNVLYNKASPPPKGPIIFVAPGFETQIKENYKKRLDSLVNVDEAYMNTVRQPWSLKLARQLDKAKGFQIYEGLEATESNIMAGVPQANVLYFSTHAIADATDPLRSKLVLAKEIGPQIEDGYLHAYELFGLELDADLAILNACESGIGNLQAGEGMISLAYSLQFAGCRTAALSLWKVDEKVNTQITATFLDFLQKGHDKSEALRLAKLAFLEDQSEVLRHPFYWGGMVLMGQDGPIHWQGNQRPWWLWSILGLCLLLLALTPKLLNLR